MGASTVGVNAGDGVAVESSSVWVKAGVGVSAVEGIVVAFWVGVAVGVGSVVRKEHAQITTAIARLLSQSRLVKDFLIVALIDTSSPHDQSHRLRPVHLRRRMKCAPGR